MSHTNSDVVTRFLEGKYCSNGRGSMYSEDGSRPTLYSYGRHFPLLVQRGNGNDKVWYIANGDKYSVTTSQHQSIVRSALTVMEIECPTVAFSALSAAGINFNTCELVDFHPDKADHRYFDTEKEAHEWIETAAPWAGIKSVTKHEGYEKPYYASYHSIGSAVLMQGDDCYLCSMDEGTYFIVKLPETAGSVEHAFQILKPQAIREAEKQGTSIRRQGEWFFIPKGSLGDINSDRLPEMKILKKDFSKSESLPRSDVNSNMHVPTRLFKNNGDLFVTGIVRHKLPDSTVGSGQHRALNLKDQYYTAHENTAIGAWSASGNVD